MRYIIGDVNDIVLLLTMLNNKLRTPKMKRLNVVIAFINQKYAMNLKSSNLDNSCLGSNSWFAGFTVSDGHFYFSALASAFAIALRQK